MSNTTSGNSFNFWEWTGIDWLPVIWNEKKYFPYSPRPSKQRIEEIEKKTAEIPEDTIDEVIAQFGKINEEVQSRWVYIENKANTLLSFTGIGTTFAFGISQFSFILTNTHFAIPLSAYMVAIYVAIAVSLFTTITLVRKVMSVAGLSSPRPSDFLGLREWNRLLIKRQYAGSLLVAYEYNTSIVNDKVTYFMGAEKWFGNTIALLLLLLFTVGIGIAISPAQATVSDLNSVVATPQNVSPTFTATPPKPMQTNILASSPTPMETDSPNFGTLPVPMISPTVSLSTTLVVTP